MIHFVFEKGILYSKHFTNIKIFFILDEKSYNWTSQIHGFFQGIH